MVCDVSDNMIKPTVLPEGIEWNDEQREKCLNCQYHYDVDYVKKEDKNG